jgi:PPOX class probable F420-dependent enzyme
MVLRGSNLTPPAASSAARTSGSNDSRTARPRGCRKCGWRNCARLAELRVARVSFGTRCYGPAMTALPESARTVLESAALAHLVTLEPDGSPQVSIVWVGLDGDEIVAAHLPEHRKIRNVRRDPRVALSVEAGSHNAIGLAEYLVVHGRARITEGGAPTLLQQLARTYLGPDVRFPTMDDPPPGYITHITVERIGGVGPWAR